MLHIAYLERGRPALDALVQAYPDDFHSPSDSALVKLTEGGSYTATSCPRVPGPVTLQVVEAPE